MNLSGIPPVNIEAENLVVIYVRKEIQFIFELIMQAQSLLVCGPKWSAELKGSTRVTSHSALRHKTRTPGIGGSLLDAIATPLDRPRGRSRTSLRRTTQQALTHAGSPKYRTKRN